ncbi:MAG: lipase chaperone [Marinobacter sp.]|nr:lipase chaperone [Marinobacter sp.]
MTRISIGPRRWLIPGALSAALAGGVLWYGLTGTPQPAASAPGSAAGDFAGATKSVAPPSEADTKPVIGDTGQAPGNATTPESLGAEPFAPSLAGTDIDGALQADGNGQLIINLQVRDFFDYFLSTVGEVSPEVAIGQIQQMAESHLPSPAADQALALLDQYLAYKQAALTVMQTRLDPARRGDPAYQLAALGDALTQLKKLRQATFDANVHDAFFGQQEAYSEYTLATLAIQQRQDLSDQGKQALIEWHRNQLPEAMQATEKQLAESSRQQQARVAAIASASSPEEAGQRLSELGLDSKGTADVVSYLKDREQFDQRFQTFRKALDQQAAPGLAEQDIDANHEALLQQYFPDQQERTWARLRMLGNS